MPDCSGRYPSGFRHRAKAADLRVRRLSDRSARGRAAVHAVAGSRCRSPPGA